MGVFDTVHFNCPHCRAENSEQTKNGPCLLYDFVLNQNAEATLGVLGNYQCLECGKPFVIELVSKPVAMARPMSDEEFKDWMSE